MHGFGQSSDMAKFAPKAILTSLEDNWGPYYVQEVKAVMDGTWKSHDTWGGIAAGMVVMGPYENMPDDVKAMAEQTEADIKPGKVKPFAGPDRQAGRVCGREGGRGDARQGDPRPQLVREGRRRQAAAVSGGVAGRPPATDSV